MQPVTISIKSNVESAMAKWGVQTKKTINYATRKAVAKTAEAIRQSEYAEMRRVFNAPTPYTLNSVENKMIQSDPATARVWLKYFSSKGNPAEKFLMPEIFGGSRTLKRFERALANKGVLPPNQYIVPGSACPLDAFGNIPARFIVQILSYFEAFPESGYKANMTDKRRKRMAKGTKSRHGVAYFVGSPGGAPYGIWRRNTSVHVSGSGVEPIMIFVKAPHYRALMQWETVGRRTIATQYVPNFNAAMRDALTRRV